MPRFGCDVRLSDQRLRYEIARERSQYRAVARRLTVDEIGGRDGGGLRHVLDDDCRMAWDVFLQIFCEKPRADIGVAADRMSDDQPYLLALVEIWRRLAVCAEGRSADQQERR